MIKDTVVCQYHDVFAALLYARRTVRAVDESETSREIASKLRACGQIA